MSNIGLLFPGQGSQYIGMGKSLYSNYQIARETFEEANDVLGYDLKKLCFEGTMEELTLTSNAQPAILTTSIAAYRVIMQELSVVPKFAAGHSLGEFSALTSSGVMSFQNALKITHKRGLLMQDALPPGEGTMLVVFGIPEWDIEEVCLSVSSANSIVTIANYNTFEQTVISGNTDAVKRAKEKFESMGATTVPLNVSSCFHSPLMSAAAAEFRYELDSYTYNKFEWPVISNVTATPYSHKQFVIGNLTSQMSKPVQWYKSIQYMMNQGVDTFIELGPKKVLKNLVENISKNAVIHSFDNVSDLSKLHVADIVSKPDGIGLITACIAAAVSTKNNNWDNEAYETGVIEPYNKLVELRELLIESKTKPTVEQMRYAIDLLKTIFDTKLIPTDIQDERFKLIFTNSFTMEFLNTLKV